MEQISNKIFLFAVRRTKSPRAGDARCMGDVGHLLFELTLALAARRARGNVCSFRDLCVFSLSTTLDGPSRNCFVLRRRCLVDLYSSLT